MNHKGFFSVNVCTHCRKNLSLTADRLGMKQCAECVEFRNRGIYTTKQYNEWLKNNAPRRTGDTAY